MIIVVLYEGIQGAVDGVVLAGLDLDGDGGEAVVVVDQVIHLALAAVVVIEQLAAVGGQLLGDHAFIDGAEVDPRLIVQDRADVAAVQYVRQQSHVVPIELEQIFADGLREGEHGIGDRVDVQDDSRGDQVFKLILIVGKPLAALVLDVLKDHPLLFVLQIGGDHLIDPADLQLFVVVRFILCRVVGIERADVPVDRSHLHNVGVREEGVHRVGQAADQQVFSEEVHDLLVDRGVQALARKEFFAHHVDGEAIKSVRQQEFLKIQREHALDLDAPDGDRARLFQRDAEQGPAGDIGVSIVLFQKFQHGQQMGIGLDLIEEDQRVLLPAHFFAGNGADLKIEILHRADLLKQPGTVLILHTIQLYIVFKELLPDVANNKRLSDLPGSVDDEHLIGV